MAHVAPPAAPCASPRRSAGARGAAAGLPAGVVAWPLDAAARAQPARRLPRLQPELVSRPRIVTRLLGASHAPLAVVIAPAGYGKTTVLAEWAQRDRRPFAWIRLGGRHNDVVHLLADVAAALDEIEPLEDGVLAALAAGRATVPTVGLPRLGRALAGRRRPFVLVLDDVHVVHDAESLHALAAMVEHIAPGSALALASRSEPKLGLGRLRAQRMVVELRARDLAMTQLEAGALLARAGADLDAADVELLVRRTEGWPAGLYLAALSLRGQPAGAASRFAGDDRLVADYLREELLSGLPADRIAFLTRTSLLERLSGPLCDAVLAGRRSAQTLRDLSRSDLLVAPLDSSDSDYRYHTLFAEMLRAELRRAEPEREPALHRRASRWHEERGDVERAIEHAAAAGDVDRAGDLLWAVAPSYAASGRGPTVERWLAGFADDQISGRPSLALTAATTHLVRGGRDLVEHWVAAAERNLDRAPADRRAALEAAIAVLRAAVARDGLARMGEDAARARAIAPDDGAWRPFACLLLGVARHLTGDREAARPMLEDGARRGALAAPDFQALCLSQLALLSVERADWGEAAPLSARARSHAERSGMRDQPLSALVYAVSATVRAHRGRLEDARRDLKHATRLLATGAELAPWWEAQARIVLASAALRLGDAAGARTALGEAAAFLARTPDAAVLREWLDEAWDRADAFSADSFGGPSSLTAAELRILRFLPSHLSFREIGGRLHVSTNTVKTQALAVYRKLDVCSRSDAVQRARQIGLLDRPLSIGS